MKKILYTLTLILAITSFAKAQNIGFSINRGVSGLYPNSEFFKRTHSQMIGLGLTHSMELRDGLDFQTGLNLAANSTTGSIQNSHGMNVLLPRWYFYLEVPLHYSTKLYHFGDKRKTNTYIKGLYGANIGFLWHERDFKTTEWSDKSDLLNYGGTIANQYVNEASANMEFAIGPQVKAMTTGQSLGRMNVSYGLRLDWRFNY